MRVREQTRAFWIHVRIRLGRASYRIHLRERTTYCLGITVELVGDSSIGIAWDLAEGLDLTDTA